MSLLDDASLLVTPNAEKEGKLYSIIPTNGNGDFSVTRATTATRVNAAGLVELVPYNLLQQSEVFSNVYWVKTATTISANTTTAPNGTLTADTLIETASGATKNLKSGTFNFVNGASYSMSIYAKNTTTGRGFIQIAGFALGTGAANIYANFNLNDGTTANATGGTATITSVGDGWYRCSFSFTCGNTITEVYNVNLINSMSSTSFPTYTGDITKGIFLWGAQLVEGTSALDYQMTETRLNIPRLDYSLGSCPNILLEPQRTNLALFSEQFDNAWWSKVTLSITANTTTSPSGVVNADTLDEGTTSSIHRLLGTAVSVTAGSTNSFSLYVKKGTMRYFRLVINDANDTTRWIAGQFDLDTQTFTTGSGVGGGGTIVSTSIQSVGNGWFRVNLVGSITLAGQVFPIVFGSDGTAINAGDGRGGNPYTGTNRTLFIWGAQLEAGAYATSYIPTTSASVTRNADVISRGNIFTNGLITASGGTWFVDLSNNRVLTRDGGANGLFINSGTDVTSGNGFSIRNAGSLNRYSIFKLVGGTSTLLYLTTTNSCKVAIKWNGTTADIFENGVKIVAATSFTPTSIQNLISNASATPYNINSMALFPTALTDTQCIALTT